MPKFKNMKIAINNQQPLDEVVRELERLGYECFAWRNDHTGYIFTWNDGDYTNTEDLNDIDHEYHILTTITELKNMGF